MEYMFQPGFLGTRAPFFMDFVTIIVAVLPLLVLSAIYFARVKAYETHASLQTIIFVVSVIVVGYFEYGVRHGGGFDTFMEGSGVSYGYAFWVLIFHIAIAVTTLVLWILTLKNAREDRGDNALPGGRSGSHKKSGMRTFMGIVATSLTGIWVYIILFVS